MSDSLSIIKEIRYIGDIEGIPNTRTYYCVLTDAGWWVNLNDEVKEWVLVPNSEFYDTIQRDIDNHGVVMSIATLRYDLYYTLSTYAWMFVSPLSWKGTGDMTKSVIFP